MIVPVVVVVFAVVVALSRLGGSSVCLFVCPQNAKIGFGANSKIFSEFLGSTPSVSVAFVRFAL